MALNWEPEEDRAYELIEVAKGVLALAAGFLLIFMGYLVGVALLGDA